MQVTPLRTGSGVVVTGELDAAVLERFFQEVRKKLNSEMTNLEAAVQQAGDDMKMEWAASGSASLKSSASYINAIEEGRQYPFEGSKLNYYIEHNQKTRDGKNLGLLLEFGYPPFDMKEKILQGRDKLIIPFHYGSPKQSILPKLPGGIYSLAKKHLTAFKWNETANAEVSNPLTRSKIVEAFKEAADNINPKKLKHFTALPGIDRQHATTPLFSNTRYAYAETVQYRWKTGQFTGLRANKTKSGKETAVHSFSVFRTISKKSALDSWIHPGGIAYRIFNTAFNKHIPKVRPLLEKGIELDLAALNQ